MLWLDCSLLDVVQFAKLFDQISVAFLLNAALLRSLPAWGAFAVSAVERVHDIHTRHDLAERCKALTVEPIVVGEIYEHLGGAGVGTGRRERDQAALVALPHRIVLDPRLAPYSGKFRVGVDA